MDWQARLYLTPYLISLAISGGVGMYAWRRRTKIGATPLALGAIVRAWMTLCYVFELTSPNLGTKILWDDLQFVGMCIVPMALLAFAQEYTRRKPSHLRRAWGLLATPLIVFILLILTNGLHGWLRSAVCLLPGEPFAALSYDFTVLVSIMFIYLAGLTLAGIFLLVTEFLHSQPFYRAQVGVIIIGSLVPLIGGALTVTGRTSLFHRDTSPFTFAIGDLVIAWGLFRYRIFDIVPVARDRVIEGMRDAVIVLDTHDRIVDLNPIAQEILGTTSLDVIGRPAAQMLSRWPALTEQYQDVEEAHTEIAVNIGEEQRHFDLRLSPLRGRRSHRAGRLIVLRDITERVRAESQRDVTVEELKQRHRELTTLAEAATAISSDLSLGIVLQTVAEQMTRALDLSGCTLSRWEREAHLVETLVDYDTVEPDTADPTGTTYDLADYPATRRVLETGQPVVIQQDDPTGDEAELALMEEMGTLTLLMLPLVARDQVVGLVELINKVRARDYTPDQIRLGQSLAAQAAIAIENARLFEAAQQELVERVRAEKALRRRTAELEARNEELDAFAHTAAHDLKGPLGPMVGYAQVLEDHYARLPEEDVRSYLRVIAEGGIKMGNIINELLLLSTVRKMEELELQSLDMAGIVNEALARLVHEVEEQQANIILPPQGAWPAALGYGPWVEDVWANYISNAIKYGGQPPRVELGFDIVAGGEWVVDSDHSLATNHYPLLRFWVRDNGPGLSPKEQERLFAPFTRLDRVRAKGHGLGLSIVRRIVEKLDGQVGVESEIGVGSTFWFTLPMADDRFAGRRMNDEPPP